MNPLLLDPSWRQARLASPRAAAHKPRLVIDTDAANEIDDQFALAWALLSPDALAIEAVYAAPFSFAHRRAALAFTPRDERPFAPPALGMARSLDEVRRVFALCAVAERGRVFAGAEGYLPAADQPLHCPAAHDLVQRALAQPADEPLYVLVLGCPTHVASALLIEPRIAERIVVVWTSGYPSHAPQVNHSFNLEQDLHASRVLFDSAVPLVYLPGFHVGAQLRLSLPEVERWVQPGGAIGGYLHHLFTHNPLWEQHGVQDFFAHSWVIWDLICVAWLLQPDWVPSELVPTPMLDDDKRWQPRPGAWLMREAHAVKRDAVFRDLFQKLASAPSS